LDCNELFIAIENEQSPSKRNKMSKEIEVIETFLAELIDIMNEKPAIAKRLLNSIEHHFIQASFDPVEVFKSEGLDELRTRLKKLIVRDLRNVIQFYEIPCANIGRRRKDELVQLIVDYCSNSSGTHRDSNLSEA